MKKMIPLSIPNFEGNERKYVDDALDQGWVSTGGAYITTLEKNLAEFVHTHNVAACQSGTSALHMSMVDCGVLPGDMVIVPTLTFIAAVNPVKYQFAVPVFMDCDDSLCLDPNKLRQFCEEECRKEDGKLIHKKTGKHVKVVVVVHVFGNMADMENIMDIAGEYHLQVIEDATEALGTRYTEGRYTGKYAGTIGDYGAYSFNGNKIITTGGGGAVTAKTSEIVDHLRYLSTQAKDDPHYYIHNEVGFNYRMTNLQAALGVAQMEELEDFIERKHKNYDLYKGLFEDFELGKILGFRKGTYSNQWFYSLVIDRTKVKGTMRDIITRLEENGVQTRAIWGLIHEQKPYSDSLAYKMEKAPYYSSCVLNFPSTTQLTEEAIVYSADAIKDVLGEFAE
ncbi:LegC family aminotransferase [Holdemania filiformis]|uniref:LegC family aminotransferase n=1 Tax=Holdemania filiformis TaxID=61171 RepID=A0A412G5Y5_9FIRM|nr:LegC family aminotransferase [Holdemania filiformis]RGR76267.1 LegC family aminotransferase [Holdemania filiformis]